MNMNKNKRDYYSVLGVARNVDGAGLKKAYRKLVMQYHPDRHPDDPGAAAKMQEINEAYETLSDEKKRAEYDSGGSQAQANSKAGARRGGANINDFDFDLGDIFGGTNFGDYAGGVKKKNANKTANKKSGPERGGQSQKRETERERAEREWKEKRDSGNLCKKCNGLGKERVTVASGFGKVTQTRECSVCHGKGTV